MTTFTVLHFLAFHQLSHLEKCNDGCNNRISFNSWILSMTGDSKANTDPLMITNDGGVH